MTDEPANVPLDSKPPTSPTGRRPSRNKRWIVGAVLLAILVPALILPSICSSMLAQVSRVQCASNLRQIGQALQMYARDHGGHLPNQLGALLTTEDISPFVFVCEASDQQTSTAQSPQAIADEIDTGHHVSYVYLGAGLTDAVPADTTIVYEPLANHGRGINVLHADWSVEWLVRKDAIAFLNHLRSATRPIRSNSSSP